MSRDTAISEPVGIHPEYLTYNLCFLRYDFECISVFFTLFILDFSVSVRFTTANIVTVFNGKVTAIHHNALRVFKILVSSLKFTLKVVSVSVVIEIIAVLERDNERVSISKQFRSDYTQ